MSNEKNYSEETDEVKKELQEETEETTATDQDNECGEEQPADELTPEEKQEKELAEARQANDELKDKYLRLSAEFDNYRKRTMKEKAELIKNGGEKTISAILPVLDDMERALQNMEKWDDVKATQEGVTLIFQKFQKLLSQEGLEKMNPIGENFDTDFHEAVALVPAPSEEEKGKVLDCVQTGYKLNEKVIRHAKVVVAQ